VFFGKPNFVEVLSNVHKEGAEVIVERTTRCRYGGFLGEKGSDVVVDPGGGRKLGEGVAGKCTQEAIDMASSVRMSLIVGLVIFRD
jgi:hypothetical protein